MTSLKVEWGVNSATGHPDRGAPRTSSLRHRYTIGGTPSKATSSRVCRQATKLRDPDAELRDDLIPHPQHPKKRSLWPETERRFGVSPYRKMRGGSTGSTGNEQAQLRPASDQSPLREIDERLELRFTQHHGCAATYPVVATPAATDPGSLRSGGAWPWCMSRSAERSGDTALRPLADEPPLCMNAYQRQAAQRRRRNP